MASIDDFKKAGKIAAKIKEESKKLVMPGASVLDIAETIEDMIIKEGARPAFPANISLNEVAAHYTPKYKDELTLDNEVVKIDFGVELDGAIVDNAYTVDLSGEHEDLVTASKEALEEALSFMKPGVRVGEIGAKIEEKIKEYGFLPISNLTGHMIKEGRLHAGIEIPNIATDDPYLLKEGDIFAVEPFATTGKGVVNDTEDVEIFSLDSPAPVRLRQSRRIISYVIENYALLPFAERWLIKEFNSKLLVTSALKEMLDRGVLMGYPMLKDKEGSFVAQFEETILVTKDGVEVLTR